MALAASLGLTEHGEYPGSVKIESASRLYPDHLFKIGYLRSPYNDGGIDRQLDTRLGTSLSEIFEAGERYEFRPEWDETRARAVKTLEDWRALNNATGGKPYQVFEAKMNMFAKPDDVIRSRADALKAFQDEFDKHKETEAAWKNYGNKIGEFFLGEPLKVAALIPGATDFMGSVEPTTYVITEAGDSEAWYTQALEIVIENCEWVLEQPDKELYWLHWSS